MLLQGRGGGHCLGTLAIATRLFGFLLDVLILTLFFFADTMHMFLLGHRTPLARMGHLFGPLRGLPPERESKTSARRDARASACVSIGTLLPLALPRRRRPDTSNLQASSPEMRQRRIGIFERFGRSVGFPRTMTLGIAIAIMGFILILLMMWTR
jgi:hypothetical protein